MRVRWTATGYQSKKNKVTFVVIDQQPLFYGGATYVLADKFNSGFPTVDFQRKTVCLCSQSARAPNTAPNSHAPNATRRSAWLQLHHGCAPGERQRHRRERRAHAERPTTRAAHHSPSLASLLSPHDDT